MPNASPRGTLRSNEYRLTMTVAGSFCENSSITSVPTYSDSLIPQSPPRSDLPKNIKY